METQIKIPVLMKSKLSKEKVSSSCCAPKNNASVCCTPNDKSENVGDACCAQPEDGSACCDK